MFKAILAGCAIALGLAASAAAAQEAPSAYCSREGDDNMSRPLPEAMAAKAKEMFGLPADKATQPIWRCMDGKVMVCLPGGERYCGRADTQTIATPEADGYCADHPDSAAVPSWATGRDTIFKWSCDGQHAKNEGAVRSVDPRGFVREYWKVLE
jgi:hypothetical protein